MQTNVIRASGVPSPQLNRLCLGRIAGGGIVGKFVIRLCRKPQILQRADAFAPVSSLAVRYGCLTPNEVCARNSARRVDVCLSPDMHPRSRRSADVQNPAAEIGFWVELYRKDRKSTRLNSSHLVISYA